MPLTIGRAIPRFTAKATAESIIKSADFKGRWTILYFYPRDNTPGCTNESKDFADAYNTFGALGAYILGASRDTMTSHEKFKEKLSLPFELISDPDETLCTLFDVIRTKNMYGKQVLGIERSTFLFNPQGKLAHEWRKVKVAGHVAEVLTTLETLQETATTD